jgi:TolA-binding protein
LAFEVAAILVLGAIVIVISVAIGRPLMQAYSEKMRATFKELEPQQLKEFQGRVSELEEQVRQMKKQLENVQATSDFAMNFLQEKGEKLDASQKINLKAESER